MNLYMSHPHRILCPVSPLCIIRIVYVEGDVSSLSLDTDVSGPDWVASSSWSNNERKVRRSKQPEIERQRSMFVMRVENIHPTNGGAEVGIESLG